jgi:DNA sulfur modification protein DndB
LQKDLGEFEANKKSLATAIRDHYGKDFKPKIMWLFVLDNISVLQADRARAKEHNISLITDREITYFEEISKALGQTARQQFKAEYLAGIEIPALENKRIPAAKTKIGKHAAYTFSANLQTSCKLHS